MSLCALSVSPQSDIFSGLYQRAQKFAHDYPQEKAYLHFDNSSYYQGDTIWFKAYLVTASDLRPSRISRPLYVELVDQLGNVMQKQIIRMENGEGEGYISLANAFFTGYYEVRAYTRWMLAFDQPQYFSRTFPVYRKKLRDNEPRSIASYRMDKSMKQRPKVELSNLTARFFPEGGRLVRGLTSVVGFETLSNDSGWVEVKGKLIGADGKAVQDIATVHDGMGTFSYTPGEKPGRVELEYRGKQYRFELPEAEPEGYVMTVSSRLDVIDVMVKRSNETLSDSLALFLYSRGLPCAMTELKFEGRQARLVRFRKADLPAGVARLALINTSGQTVSSRFCFVPPTGEPQLEASLSKRFYQPFQPITGTITLRDSQGQPLRGAKVSVSVNDAMTSDYQAFDNTILTDLLLTSELKGYVHQPGYYFSDKRNTRLNKQLDNLLLIRGWRSYNAQTPLSGQTFQPKYLPEQSLALNGHVDAWLRGTQKDLELSIFAQRDSTYITGTTKTDSLGNFTVPIDDFVGTMDAIIQTRKKGKQRNRMADVLIDRSVEVPLRPLALEELNPVYDLPVDTTALFSAEEQYEQSDSTLADVHMLQGITVSGGRSYWKNIEEQTRRFERNILGYYNIRQYVDDLRDKGKAVPNDYGYLLHTLNPAINREGTRYNSDSLRYTVNGRDIDQFFFNRYIDEIETALLYFDFLGNFAYVVDKNTFRAREEESKSYFNDIRTDTINGARKTITFVRCDMTMKPRWDANKSYVPQRGIRRTVIQGYEEPARFYSPAYPDVQAFDATEDRRRTLYWNPSMTTDQNGNISLKCYNGRNFTSVNLRAETLAGGRPAAVEISSGR